MTKLTTAFMVGVSFISVASIVASFAAGFTGNGFSSRVDADNDKVINRYDNCQYDYNPDQLDIDGDGYGDACDGCQDIDGDGYGDPEYDNASCITDNCPDIFNPDQLDSDRDGVGDVCDTEVEVGLDADGDGVGDAEDNCPTVLLMKTNLTVMRMVLGMLVKGIVELLEMKVRNHLLMLILLEISM